MSFSVKTKDELARIELGKFCCQKAELAALIKMDGIIQLSGQYKVALQLSTENAAIARRIFRMFKEVYDLHTEILVSRKARLKKNNFYLVRLGAGEKTMSILKELGMLNEKTRLHYGLKKDLIKRECCRRAYLRGIFLGGGSVNNPEGTYHLEIITNNQHHARDICDLINKYYLTAKISTRKNWQVIYLKESEHIVSLLNLMGAHAALLNFENVRIYKDMRNQVNRLVNCETANLNKTVNAAVRQVDNIKFIADTIGLNKLAPSLREMAEARLQNPDISLKELGEMLEPPVGKSGVNHRIRKLEKMAEQIRNSQGS
ncbi:MAG: DNA-binding protein WhiA [Desulfitobacterium hafniense]|nr:DNA-binding protein WhiA [Desulfitobacterium hafniense]